jgi:hypothetical protein
MTPDGVPDSEDVIVNFFPKGKFGGPHVFALTVLDSDNLVPVPIPMFKILDKCTKVSSLLY